MSTQTVDPRTQRPEAEPPVATGAPRRRAWTTVALREIQVKLTDRNFLMSTGFSIVVLLAVLLVPVLFSGGPTSYTVGVADDRTAGLVTQAQTALQVTDQETTITTTELDSADAEGITEALRDGEYDVALVERNGTLTLVSDGPAPTDLQGVLTDAVRTEGLTANAEASGTTLEELTAGTTLALDDVAEQDSDQALVARIVGLVFGMLFYLASLMFGMSIATSVVEEKQSRIVEILAAKIPISQLLTGKVVGNAALAMAQLLLFVGIGLIGLTVTDYDQYLAMISGAVAWFIPFFIVGFMALACLWAAAGALCSRQEDVQSTSTPLTLVLVGVFIVGLNLEGSGQVIGSFVPVLSTILMPMRIASDDTVWWEPALALLITLAFCAITIRFGALIYRRALLQTGARLSYRQALRMGD